MKFAITISANMPVQQFVVVEAPTEEEAIQALHESINDSFKDSMKIINIEPITEDDFKELLEENKVEPVDETAPARTIN